MEEYSQNTEKIFYHLCKLPENKTCFECGLENKRSKRIIYLIIFLRGSSGNMGISNQWDISLFKLFWNT